MKHFKSLLFILIFGSIKINAQEATIKTEKLNYKIDEEIQLVFEATKEFDSISESDLSDFKIINGPIKSTDNSNINGVKEYKQKLSYKLSPKSAGKFTIHSPIYYLRNEKIIGENLIITIENNKLSAEEKRLIELKKIAEKFSKPEGTIRFVILNGIGYVEEFDNKKWEFKRELTKKEIKKLSKK